MLGRGEEGALFQRFYVCVSREWMSLQVLTDDLIMDGILREAGMQPFLLERLREVTEEETQILQGNNGVEKERYAVGSEFTVDSRKMLAEGQLITVRKHTRFVRFPLHRHTFVEVIYVCQGKVVNLIDGKPVEVCQGELLFLNQYTKHEILPSGMDDLAVNFMVLPEFFDVASQMIGKGNVLADFLVNILRQNQEKGEYLHFKVSEIYQIQNLMENMILSLLQGDRQNKKERKRKEADYD